MAMAWASVMGVKFWYFFPNPVLRSCWICCGVIVGKVKLLVFEGCFDFVSFQSGEGNEG
jgi:hypothetical protein